MESAPSMRELLRVPAAALTGSTSASAAASAERYQIVKGRLHMKLIEQFDLSSLETLAPELLRQEIARLTERLLAQDPVALNEAQRRQLIRDIQHEMMGFGPLEWLMADPSVSDILVNAWHQIYVERRGRLELTSVTFQDEAHLMRIIDKIVSRVGRRIDESSPMVDARLPDGSRVNVAIAPVAVDGPVMSIRRFAHIPLDMQQLTGDPLQSLTPAMARFLQALVQSKVNVLISGGTGSGKTTLLNILSGFISHGERVVTIEDAAELQLQQPHVVRLETRPPNIEGQGEISQRALVRNALRMRPDRIVIGEVRGGEALDMLQAMNTGHEGSMTTIHANTPRDALSRLENMMSMAGLNLPSRVARQQVAAAVSVVVQTLRLIDGRRKVTSIQEVSGMEGEMLSLQEIFGFKQTGVGPSGTVIGHFAASGVRPRITARLQAFGIDLPEDLFDPSQVVECGL